VGVANFQPLAAAFPAFPINPAPDFVRPCYDRLDFSNCFSLTAAILQYQRLITRPRRLYISFAFHCRVPAMGVSRAFGIASSGIRIRVDV
jgi:hypothetical protein